MRHALTAWAAVVITVLGVAEVVAQRPIPIRVFVRPVERTADLVDPETTRRVTARVQLIAALKRDKVNVVDRADVADVFIDVLVNLEPPPEKQSEIGWKPFIGFYPKKQKTAPINVAISVGDFRTEILGHVDTDAARRASQKIQAWIKDNQAILRAKKP